MRELAAVIDRAAILGNGERLEIAKALGVQPLTTPASPPVTITPTVHPATDEFPTLDHAMRRHIEAALQRTHGRIEGPRGAAALLHINPHTLRARMRKLRIDWSHYR